MYLFVVQRIGLCTIVSCKNKPSKNIFIYTFFVGNPDSPRNKTQQGRPLRSRAVRRAEARERKKRLNEDLAAEAEEILEQPAGCEAIRGQAAHQEAERGPSR